MEKNTAVQCPKCQHAFQVGDVLRKEIEEDLKSKFNIKWTAQKAQLEATIEADKKALQEQQQALRQKENDFERQLVERVKAQKAEISAQLKADIEEQYALKMQDLKQENDTKTEKLRNMYQLEADNERLKRDMDMQADKIKMEMERQLTLQLQAEAEKIKEQEQDRSRMKILEREQTIEGLRKQLEEATRRAEQGSMQLQGEVQEIALQQTLQSFFIYDDIQDVPKGINGADVIQVVRNNRGEECGKIAYESKRTKEFNPDWIKKLKQDALLVKADLCVIVTEAKPKGLTEIGYEEGVWICSFREARSLALALREGLLRVSEAFAGQTNKGEKMQMLYDYLTGSQFKMQINAIFEAYQDMLNSLNKEKATAMRQFAEREKQLDKLLLNASSFHTSIRTIAGNAVPEVPLLQEEEGLEIPPKAHPYEKALNTAKLFN